MGSTDNSEMCFGGQRGASRGPLSSEQGGGGTSLVVQWSSLDFSAGVRGCSLAGELRAHTPRCRSWSLRTAQVVPCNTAKTRRGQVNEEIFRKN